MNGQCSLWQRPQTIIHRVDDLSSATYGAVLLDAATRALLQLPHRRLGETVLEKPQVTPLVESHGGRK